MNKFYIFLLFICLFFFGCVAPPNNPERWMENEKNACLPTAIAFKKGLDRQGIWSEVLIYQYTDTNNKNKKSGHAITVYLYPPGKNQLWSYDYFGSYRIRVYKDDVIQVARESAFVRGNWNQNVFFAEYIK